MVAKEVVEEVLVAVETMEVAEQVLEEDNRVKGVLAVVTGKTMAATRAHSAPKEQLKS